MTAPDAVPAWDRTQKKIGGIASAGECTSPGLCHLRPDSKTRKSLVLGRAKQTNGVTVVGPLLPGVVLVPKHSRRLATDAPGT